MGRPKQKPTIIKQLNSLVMQATEEKKYGLVKKILEILEYEQPIPWPEKKEAGNAEIQNR